MGAAVEVGVGGRGVAVGLGVAVGWGASAVSVSSKCARGTPSVGPLPAGKLKLGMWKFERRFELFAANAIAEIRASSRMMIAAHEMKRVNPDLRGINGGGGGTRLCGAG